MTSSKSSGAGDTASGSRNSLAANSRITLTQIRLIQQVARLHNITAAGHELGMSGSLASRQIATLECQLGVRLFQRTTRSIRLTEAGEHALEWANQTLQGFVRLNDLMTTMTQTPSGVIRLAVNYYAADAYLPRMLAEFCNLYPDIKLSIITTDDLIDLVAEGIDVAVHSGHIPDSSMIGVRIREVHRILCASPAYLEQHGTPASINELYKHRCLTHSSNEPVNWFFRHGNRTVGITVRSALEANNHNVLLEFARHGLGIARLGRNIVRADVEAGHLVQLLPDYACVYPSGELPNVWILYPNRRLLYRTRVLVDFLSEKLADLTSYYTQPQS